MENFLNDFMEDEESVLEVMDMAGIAGLEKFSNDKTDAFNRAVLVAMKNKFKTRVPAVMISGDESAGKSTLLNYFAKCDIAPTSQARTTMFPTLYLKGDEWKFQDTVYENEVQIRSKLRQSMSEFSDSVRIVEMRKQIDIPCLDMPGLSYADDADRELLSKIKLRLSDQIKMHLHCIKAPIDLLSSASVQEAVLTTANLIVITQVDVLGACWESVKHSYEKASKQSWFKRLWFISLKDESVLQNDVFKAANKGVEKLQRLIKESCEKDQEAFINDVRAENANALNASMINDSRNISPNIPEVYSHLTGAVQDSFMRLGKPLDREETKSLFEGVIAEMSEPDLSRYSNLRPFDLLMQACGSQDVVAPEVGELFESSANMSLALNGGEIDGGRCLIELIDRNRQLIRAKTNIKILFENVIRKFVKNERAKVEELRLLDKLWSESVCEIDNFAEYLNPDTIEVSSNLRKRSINLYLNYRDIAEVDIRSKARVAPRFRSADTARQWLDNKALILVNLLRADLALLIQPILARVVRIISGFDHGITQREMFLANNEITESRVTKYRKKLSMYLNGEIPYPSDDLRDLDNDLVK